MSSIAGSSSASSSSTVRHRKHHVFLSFRGDDTRTGFVSHLYKALTDHGINAYKDDKSITIGNFIKAELLEAIESSRFAVVVLSSDFAASAWCLDELAKVVDCIESTKIIVIPVFYHVDPSDVRRQRNSFAQAFAKHESDLQIPPEKVIIWRAAFVKVGAIAGCNVTQARNESEVVSEIVRKILKDLQDALPRNVSKGLVGIESRVKDLKRLLSIESTDVRFIGICGMSGMGKTTLAEVVYEEIRNKFEGYSFIENIKDISKQNDSDLCKLQQKILVDILKDDICVHNVLEGVSLLQGRLRGSKIIIFLDDVNHRDQLKCLAGDRDWFGNGTRIIVTTTNKDLLTAHRVDEIYTCEGLEFDDALKLFSQSAFKGHPKHGYEKLSNDIVKLTGGLPLALDAYGSLLFDKEENYWRETLEKLQQYPEEEVLGRLEVCYGRLDRNEKDIFIYVACFLKGRNKVLVKDILKNIGLYPECGIDILINRSLISIDHDDSVWMHDLLQQMGWEILRKASPRKPGKRIGLKFRQDIVNICSSKEKGTKVIEIINQVPYGVQVDDCIGDPSCFSKMKNMKFLRIGNIDFPHGLNYLPNDLRILEWCGCSLKTLPPTFVPKHIYELDMRSSQLEKMWEKHIDMPNLRSINLSGSKHLTKIPDLTSTPNLDTLKLEDCTELIELHKSILKHKRLRYLNLGGCTRLQCLGSRKMEMEALEALLLSGCSSLECIPEFGQNMKQLEHLYLDGTKIKKLPDNLGEMSLLRKLDVGETDIEELPASIHHLERLRRLYVHGCRFLSPTRSFLSTNLDMSSLCLRELDLSNCNLSSIPDSIGLLYSLRKLDLSGNDFVALPASISLLSDLRILCLNSCKRLQSLPKLSIINEDTLYGNLIRFRYYISEGGIDVSKFHASSNNTNPTVSCLDCPKLIENGTHNGVADTILKKYLQLRRKFWVIPEATFEIVAAGREIPLWFELGESDSMILEGTWIGVALCAVIAVRRPLASNIGTCMEVKYEVVAHIHVGGKQWKVPVAVNFLGAKTETQLVWYWTITDDLQRAVNPRQRSQFHLSFSVVPEDGNLKVMKFGARFIREQDILDVKQTQSSIRVVAGTLSNATSYLLNSLKWYKDGCEADPELQFFNLTLLDHTKKIINFVITAKAHSSFYLDSLREVTESVLVINQEVIKCILELKEEIWKDARLFYFIYQFFDISLRLSELHTDLVKMLKCTCDSWLIVKVALQQIEAKRRAGAQNYLETLQQLNDLEVAKTFGISKELLVSFELFCKQFLLFPRYLNDQIEHKIDLKSMRAWRKVSSSMILAVSSAVAIWDCWVPDGAFPARTGREMLEMWLRQRSIMTGWNSQLRIKDFDSVAGFLQEVKNKMDQASFVTKEDEGKMMIITDMMKKKISSNLKSNEDMSNHADEWSHNIREARITALNINGWATVLETGLMQVVELVARRNNLQNDQVYESSPLLQAVEE